MAPKNFLNNLTIPSPCVADWNSMIGNEEVRFCEHCSLDVHNLSVMTRNQAERLVARSKERLCVCYHYDPAGRPLTLPVRQKLHRINRRVSRIAAGAFTATLSITSAVAQNSTNSQTRSVDASSLPPNRWTARSSVVGTIKDQNGAVIPNATIFDRMQNCGWHCMPAPDWTVNSNSTVCKTGATNLELKLPALPHPKRIQFICSQTAKRA